MSAILSVAVLAALLGSAIIGGGFYVFSSFIMKALARIPAPQGISAMQSINVVVINRSFLGVFIGTAALCLALVAAAVKAWGQAWASWVLAAAIVYVVGTFLVTLFGNVPLNNRLAKVVAADRGGESVWRYYLERWTWLNTLRTAAAVSSTLLFALALMNSAP